MGNQSHKKKSHPKVALLVEPVKIIFIVAIVVIAVHDGVRLAEVTTFVEPAGFTVPSMDTVVTPYPVFRKWLLEYQLDVHG